MSTQKLMWVVATTLCALAGSLTLGNPLAFAERIYYPGDSFGEPGSGPGQLDGPVGVAVNNLSPVTEPIAGGDVYVVDKGNNRVNRYSTTGAYLGQFNGSGEFEVEGAKETGKAAPTGAFSGPEQVAVDNSGNPLDPSAGDVYVIDTNHEAIDKFSSTGEYLGQLTQREECEQREFPPCTKSKTIIAPLDELRGVAVDPSGDLWVLGGLNEEYGGAYVAEFSDTGAFAQWFRTENSIGSSYLIAVDPNETVYVGLGLLSEQVGTFTQEKERIQNGGWREDGEINRIGKGVTATAIVPSASALLAGYQLIDQGSSIGLYAPFSRQPRKPLEVFPGENVPKSFAGFSESFGLAVNGEAAVYTSERGADKVQIFGYVPVPTVTTGPVRHVSETSIELTGSVDPEGEPVNECYFEYGTEADVYTNKVICKPEAGAITGTKAVSVSAELPDLPLATMRSFRLVAVSGAGIEKPGKGLTISRPIATDEAASEVGASTAKVSAEINAGGLAACYRIEYGTSMSYGTSTPEECVGSGAKEEVRAELTGLQPDTSYFYRVAARNGLGGKFGEEGAAFTTFGPSTAVLPDGRVAEAVSAVGEGHDAEVYVPHGMEGTLDDLARHGLYTNLPFQAAADGNTVTYVGDPPASGGNGNEGVGGGNQYVARRSSRGGWAQVSVSASGYANDYVGFAGDLSSGVLGSPERLAEDAPEEAEMGYPNLYQRSVDWAATAEGSLEPLLGPFEPLFTTSPCLPVREFGSLLDNALSQELLFGGGNAGTDTAAAFTHLLFETNAALPSTPSSEECRAGNDLYDWVGGWRYLVNVLPGGKVEPNATFGRQGPSKNGFVSPETSQAISADGSRIYWSAVEAIPVGGGFVERPKALYVRENDTQLESEMEGEQCVQPGKACTVQVDLSQGGPGPGGGGQFWTASRDGSKVFFTDESPLTKDSTAGPGKPDLYEYDLEAPEGERLTDLSLLANPEPGVHADVQGVVGASQDGSYVYFVADGVLAEGAAPGNCDGTYKAEQRCSLYVRHGGTTKFVATLSGEDGNFSGGEGGDDGDWQADPGHRTAEATTSGHSVVFMSRRPLTGYDNEVGETPLANVFVYNADTGSLACASCNPSGEAPVATIYPEFAKDIPNELTPGSGKVWGSFLPVSDSLDDYQPQMISEDGKRVFFDSIEPLVPQDENGFLDVYEWEAQGEGSCREARGCVYLLSGGQSTDNSYLIDASANGDDTFFVSRAQLVRADHGDNDVLYDARVGGVEPPTPVACSGTGCQGAPPAPPIFATPASVTFGGTGNFSSASRQSEPHPTPKCPKGKKLSHGKCVKKPKSGSARSRKTKRSSRWRGRPAKARVRADK
jgi:hypothetical protein